MSRNPILVLEGEYGPAMMALPKDEWREFVRIYCGQGKRNATRAYMLAYHLADDQKDGAQVSASRLMHDGRIQSAILECCQKALRSLAPLALDVLEEVASNAAIAPADRTKAAIAIADRAGLHATTEHKTTVEHIGEPDQLKRIALMAKQLGVPIEKLVGARLADKAPPIIDVTPVKVAQPEDFAHEEY